MAETIIQIQHVAPDSSITPVSLQSSPQGSSAACCSTPCTSHDIPKDFDPAAFEQHIQSTIDQNSLFTRKDKVLVACSGGKDSTVLLYVLHKLGYPVEAITIDAAIGCYTQENLRNLRQMCSQLDIKLHVVAFKEEFGKSLCYIQAMLRSKGYDYRNCHTCGVLRRYLLNRESRKIGPSVIATGHNLDDEAQAVLMNLFRGNLQVLARTGPRTGLVRDSRFVPRVKPLYMTREQDIVAYSRLKQFPVHYGQCPCSSDAYRREMRSLFKAINAAPEQIESIKANILHSFLTIKPRLQKHFAASSPIESCELCGEPASNKVCSACSLIEKLHEPAPSGQGLQASLTDLDRRIEAGEPLDPALESVS